MKNRVINGRFLSQPLAGVQRYATEMSAALGREYPEQLEILAPPNTVAPVANIKIIGTSSGQLWEQFELPKHVHNRILLNLGNTAPAFIRRQIVVLHDAGVYSTPEAYSRKFRLWYKTLQFVLARRGAKIVTVSNFARGEIARALNISIESIAVAGEGADHMERVIADQDALSQFALEKNGYVLVVGTLAAHKNLSALNQLADRLVGRGMVLAITGAFGAAAFQTGSQTALPKNARYLGRVSDSALKALFQGAGCFVFPSRYEGFGLPAVEAMACGCAVVAADIPALRECCGDAALYCDPNSPGAIADVVLGLLDNQTKLDEYRIAAKLHVANLTWAKAAQTLSRIVLAQWPAG
jgi:glycosyltransferase involved in cell wall biosynthesis